MMLFASPVRRGNSRPIPDGTPCCQKEHDVIPWKKFAARVAGKSSSLVRAVRRSGDRVVAISIVVDPWLIPLAHHLLRR